MRIKYVILPYYSAIRLIISRSVNPRLILWLQTLENFSNILNFNAQVIRVYVNFEYVTGRTCRTLVEIACFSKFTVSLV